MALPRNPKLLAFRAYGGNAGYPASNNSKTAPPPYSLHPYMRSTLLALFCLPSLLTSCGSSSCRDTGTCAALVEAGALSADSGAGKSGNGGAGKSGSNGDSAAGGDGADASTGGVSGEGGISPLPDGGNPCAPCNGNTPFCIPALECVECLDSTVCTEQTEPRCDVGGTFACTGCESSNDCAKFPSTPNCETVSGECVACLSSITCTTESAPRCDTAGGHVCAGCEGPSDCSKFSAAPNCKTDSDECVECTADSQCPQEDASNCGAGNTCTPCENNTDCSHINGKNVCDDGLCVDCTGTDYAACGTLEGDPLVCDSLTRTCTTDKKEHDAGLCLPCVSDAHCPLGQLCVMEEYGDPAQDVGYFCFWQPGSGVGGAPASCGTARPYVDTAADLTSIDGVSSDFCGLRVSTCISKNEFSEQACGTATPDNSQCGFDPGTDSLCVEFDTLDQRCTMTCGSNSDCPIGFSCNTGAPTPYCEL